MKNPLLVIISGPPATGKTFIGKKLAKKFNLPIISKDDLKENLFDSLGIGNREWSRKLGQASMELLYFLTEALLLARKSLIVEAPFNPKFANSRFKKLEKKITFDVIQLQLHCPKDIRSKRFHKRWDSGERHRGHIDNVNFKYIESEDEFFDPIKIQGKILDIDTAYFEKINYDKIFKVIRKYLINV